MVPTIQIDLFQGWPATAMLPVERLKQAANSALSNKAIFTEGFAYGPDEGYFPLRKNIAAWLSQSYTPVQPISAERICITGGASQNLACVLQVFTDPAQTEIIWFVEPTYHLVFRVFEDAGLSGRMRGIPEDGEGMDVAALELDLEAFDRGDLLYQAGCEKTYKLDRPYRKIYKHVIYCVPSFSNPSGTTMSHSRREALVRVARKYNALVVADDVYDFLSWGLGHPQLRLVDIDRVLDGGPEDQFGNVVSNGSFSKLIGPGCRVGWAEGTKDFIYGLSQAGSTRSGGAPSQLTSTFINDLLEDSFLPEYITNTLVPEGRRRHCILASAIKTHLGHFGVSFTPDPETSPVAGGYYIWLQLPAALTATQVCREALEIQNLVLGGGETFAVPGEDTPGGDLHRRLRLCFMWEDEGRLVEGVERLGLVIQSVLTNNE
ncbi:Pyridoxal phosphate-dependent transferase major region subdomain 1 [Penicillium robsamsonii]|uniref:Pyridoxal phosphate-dependent transferase major region subdomain 1 n=1 Tax=Penicillium robsamsonii TaxID=1792511 RepID=UPI002548549A|nr:Pyridoxal phosphate-dependent transferase major region subdomain 1 [Penicillium robsamsonii]KAJ5835480.1 Pyridoxal phosphate-dependent transferase major region subdomain 1 [Penicillium robsamsonii]